jgi:hypothetical protein
MDALKVFQKLFTTLYNYKLFALLRISFSVIGRCSLVPTSHWLQGKCARIDLSPVALGIILPAFCKHFQLQNRSFRVFEAGCRKDFQNL